jgi:hypothetical protein
VVVSIGHIEDARLKLRVARRIQQVICDDDEDLKGYDGIVLRCVREVSEWLEMPPAAPGELADLWREWQELAGGMDRGEVSTDTGGPAWQRLETVDQAIREARTCDPAGLAVQARILADSIQTGRYEGDHKLALVIAEQLEALAKG